MDFDELFFPSHVDAEVSALVYQYLKKKNLTGVLHRYESDSKLFLDTKYVCEKIVEGKWDEVESYLKPFFPENRDASYTKNVYFHLFKTKFYEAVDSGDKTKACEILEKDMKFLKGTSVLNQLLELLVLPNIREHHSLRNYPTDVRANRETLAKMLYSTIEQEKNALRIGLNEPRPNMTIIREHFGGQERRQPSPVFDRTQETSSSTDNWDLGFGFPSSAPTFPSPGPAPDTNEGPDSKKRKHETNGSSGFNVVPPAPAPVSRFSVRHILLRTNRDKEIFRILHTHAGDGVLAMDRQGQMQFWKWASPDNFFTEVPDVIDCPTSPAYLKNIKEDSVDPFVVLTGNDHYLIAGAGSHAVSLLQRNPKQVQNNVVERGHIELRDPYYKGSDNDVKKGGVVSCLEFHPKNNNYMVVGFSSGAVGIFKFGKKTTKLLELNEHRDIVTTVVFQEEAKYIASAAKDNLVCLWNGIEGEPVASPNEEMKPIKKFTRSDLQVSSLSNVSLAFRPKHDELLIKTRESLAVYNLRQNTFTHRVTRYTDIQAVAYSTDGTYINCCVDGYLVLLSANTFEELNRVSIREVAKASGNIVASCIHTHPTQTLQCVFGTSIGNVVVLKFDQNY